MQLLSALYGKLCKHCGAYKAQTTAQTPALCLKSPSFSSCFIDSAFSACRIKLCRKGRVFSSLLVADQSSA